MTSTASSRQSVICASSLRLPTLDALCVWEFEKNGHTLKVRGLVWLTSWKTKLQRSLPMTNWFGCWPTGVRRLRVITSSTSIDARYRQHLSCSKTSCVIATPIERKSAGPARTESRASTAIGSGPLSPCADGSGVQLRGAFSPCWPVVPIASTPLKAHSISIRQFTQVIFFADL